MVHQGVALNVRIDAVGGKGPDDEDLLLPGIAGAALNAGEQPGGIAESGTVGLVGSGVQQVVDVGAV